MEIVVVALLVASLFINAAILFRKLAKPSKHPPGTQFITEKMAAVGELEVFRVVTKELANEIGDSSRFWSQKKMLIIYNLEIDFRYDLKSPEFRVETTAPGKYRVHLPACKHRVVLLELQIYDEQGGRFLSSLLPNFLASAFGNSITLDDRNKFIASGRAKAEEFARAQISNLEPSIQKSAEVTLSALARGFGASEVAVMFNSAPTAQIAVEQVEKIAA